jgi:hypothetical protein
VTPRKRLGRPPRPEPTERLVADIPTDLKRRLERRAEDERRTLVATVTIALELYLERKPKR